MESKTQGAVVQIFIAGTDQWPSDIYGYSKSRTLASRKTWHKVNQVQAQGQGKVRSSSLGSESLRIRMHS